MSNSFKSDDWGFYAHKLINRMAVFTLPEELIGFYKANIDYISKHAIDPDKRRYAVKGEAVRHYMDIDHWGVEAINKVPRELSMAIINYNHFYITHGGKKNLLFDTIVNPDYSPDSLYVAGSIVESGWIRQTAISKQLLKFVFQKCSIPLYEPEEWIISKDCFLEIIPLTISDASITIEDRFLQHGVLPYNLERVYYQLTEAFKTKSKERILRLSADIGHYVGDAHVPLHTTKNYNGQLSNQDGIHAFWESRIPELFAESEFDFIVGPAQYISEIGPFIWNIVEDSHRGVSMVLEVEKNLSQITPADQQYCFDERLGAITKVQCRDYAAKYHELLDQQVEERMRTCILNLGSIWMSAWVDAGQPDLSTLLQMPENLPEIEQDSLLKKRLLQSVRPHE